MCCLAPKDVKMEDSGSCQETVHSAHAAILVLSERLVVSFLSLDVFKQRFGRKVDTIHASGEWLAFRTSSNLYSLTLRLDKVITIYCFVSRPSTILHGIGFLQTAISYIFRFYNLPKHSSGFAMKFRCQRKDF